MSEIVKYRVRSTETGEFLPEDTVYVPHVIIIKKQSMVPIYENGELMPDAILAELGLQKVGFTQEELDQELFTGYYEINPTLAERVRDYAALLGKYGLNATANADAIAAAILGNETISDAEKDMDSRLIQPLMHDIEVNYNEVTGNGLDAWNNLDKLLKYLPVAEVDSGELTVDSDDSPEEIPLATPEQSEGGSDQSDQSDQSDVSETENIEADVRLEE